MAKANKLSIAVILLIAVGVALIFLQKPAVVGPTDERITIGVMAPLTGPAAELGEHIQRGLELANSDLDGQYRLIYEDDKCTDVAAATSIAQKFVSIDQLTYVIGPLCAPPYQAAAPIFDQNQVVFMHTSAVTQPFIESAGSYGIPGLTTTLSEEDAYLARFVYDELGIQKMAVFTWNQAWAQEHRNGFVEGFEEVGGEISFDEKFELEETDFRTALLKLEQSGAEGVFIVGLNFQNGIIVKQIRETGLTVPVFGQFEIEDPAFLLNAGEAAEDVIYVYPKIDSTNVEVQTFMQNYQEHYGVAPNYYAYIGYDALKIYDWAITECGPVDRECVAQRILSLKDYSGVSGKITINPDKTISREFVIKTFKNGEPAMYDR